MGRSPRERVRKLLEDAESLASDYYPREYNTDWHGYLGVAIGSLRAALGDRGQPTDIDRDPR